MEEARGEQWENWSVKDCHAQCVHITPGGEGKTIIGGKTAKTIVALLLIKSPGTQSRRPGGWGGRMMSPGEWRQFLEM
jgi:hypothetical protein